MDIKDQLVRLRVIHKQLDQASEGTRQEKAILALYADSIVAGSLHTLTDRQIARIVLEEVWVLESVSADSVILEEVMARLNRSTGGAMTADELNEEAGLNNPPCPRCARTLDYQEPLPPETKAKWRCQSLECGFEVEELTP